MIRIYVLHTICIFFLIACFNEKRSNEEVPENIIDLPATKSHADLNQWGVIKYGSIKLRNEPYEDTKILNYLRLGTIVEVIKKDNKLVIFDGDKNYWYYIIYEGEKGWVFGTFIEIYNNYQKAIRASEKLLYGDELE